MKHAFFVSFYAIVLASNFLNAASPYFFEEELEVKSDEHPLLSCRCIKYQCTERDAFKAMVIIEAEGKCSNKVACKGGRFCECKDNRCVPGRNDEMFEVKLNEYPRIECDCTVKDCTKEDGAKMIRRIAAENLVIFKGPCKSNGYCGCVDFGP